MTETTAWDVVHLATKVAREDREIARKHLPAGLSEEAAAEWIGGFCAARSVAREDLSILGGFAAEIATVPRAATKAMAMAGGDVEASGRRPGARRIRIGDEAAAEVWRRMLAVSLAGGAHG